MFLIISWTLFNWIIGVTCLLLCLLLIKGKLSPMIVIFFIIILGSISFYFSNKKTIPYKDIIPPNHFVNTNKADDSITQKEVSAQNVPNSAINPKTPNHHSDPSTSPKIEQEQVRTIPEAYTFDIAFRTYQTEGFWVWDSTFVEALKNKTSWRKSKKGNYTISVDYTGSFSKKEVKNKRVFIYSGGNIVIKVNGKVCCCSSNISIPKGLAGRSIPVLKQIIQKNITASLLAHKTFVIQKIEDCF